MKSFVLQVSAILALWVLLSPATASASGTLQAVSDTVVASPDTTQWNLEECISYARTNNLTVLRSALLVDESTVSLKEAKAALFPSLTFSSSQNVSFEKNAEETAIYTGAYNLQANMTLYNGGRNLKNIAKQKLNIESSRFNYLATANSVEESIIKAYYQILYSHESVLTNREIVNTSLQQLERSRELSRIGKISKVELSQIESQYTTDKYQLVVAQTAEQENLLSLKQLLQLDVAAPFQVRIPVITEEQTTAPVPDCAEVLQIALATLPELQAANRDIQMARLDEQMAKGERLPAVSLQGAVGTGHNSISSYNWGGQLKNGLNEHIGVTVSVPIFDNRQIKSKIEKARISMLDSELSLMNKQTEISNTIASLHLDAVSSQDRLSAAVAQLQAAADSYELVREKYNLGMLNAVDLLVEKNNYLNATQELIQARYTLLLDLRLLNFYMTRL